MCNVQPRKSTHKFCLSPKVPLCTSFMTKREDWTVILQNCKTHYSCNKKQTNRWIPVVEKNKTVCSLSLLMLSYDKKYTFASEQHYSLSVTENPRYKASEKCCFVLKLVDLGISIWVKTIKITYMWQIWPIFAYDWKATYRHILNDIIW